MDNLQYQLGNGSWTDAGADFLDRILPRLLARENPYWPKKGPPLTNRDEVESALAAGHELKFGDAHDDVVRLKPQAPGVFTRVSQVDMVRCDCGHYCERTLVMSASLGTACPECYDRMSN